MVYNYISRFSLSVHCQLMGNAPPTLQFDRNWQIPETEKVGTVITRVRGSDNEGRPLVFGLEPLQFGGADKIPERLPFRIDPDTGVVYLNESLAGRVRFEEKFLVWD